MAKIKKGGKMNITKVNSSSMNFGSIKKSAAEKAIEAANGDVSKLGYLEEMIQEQKENRRYDIEGLPSYEYYNYIVCKKGANGGQCFMELEEACIYANMQNESDAIKEDQEIKKMKQKPTFDKMAQRLLDSCEE